MGAKFRQIYVGVAGAKGICPSNDSIPAVLCQYYLLRQLIVFTTPGCCPRRIAVAIRLHHEDVKDIRGEFTRISILVSANHKTTVIGFYD